jgi:hypothetical protein
MLKTLGSISQDKGHERKFKKTKSFLNVFRINRNLMIRPREINF